MPKAAPTQKYNCYVAEQNRSEEVENEKDEKKAEKAKQYQIVDDES